jgi:CBS domain-containing protein
MKEEKLKMFLFFSELLGRSAISSNFEPLGKLADLKVKLGELFPKVIALVVKRKKEKKLLELEWAEVQSLSGNKIYLKPEAENKFNPLKVGPEEILLNEDVLDKQVVDTFGSKIERVNDIHLIIVGEELRIVHVDFGMRGTLRRLGWIKTLDVLTNWLFSYQIPEKMISWKYVQPLASDPFKKDLKLNVTLRKLHELHPSDLADIIEELDQQSRSTVFKSLNLETAADTLQEVDPKLQLSLIETTPAELASDIIEEMDPDEATDFIAELSEEKKQIFFQKMEKPYREKIEELLKFKEGTAGSIMTKDFISLREDKTIGEAIEEFRKTSHPLDAIAYLYITDQEGCLVGVLTLRHLLSYEKGASLSKLMNPHLIKVHPRDNVQDVVEVFKKYKFMALPVVDKKNHLKGIITLQDVVEFQFEE